MKILIAEDDQVSRTALERTLQSWRHEVVVVCDGESAWNVLKSDDAPKLAILDWMMPGINGAEVCRRARELGRAEPTYLILLTAKHRKEDVAVGLYSGANDFVTKPFDRRELHARIRVGERVTALQSELVERVHALEIALAQVKQLQGLLPICCYCKNVRDDQNYWRQVDEYLTSHSDVRFSHGICPDCYRDIALPELALQGIKPDK
jgi:DNA-binding response OmpR family regulator